jgi:hypothetical protein
MFIFDFDGKCIVVTNCRFFAKILIQPGTKDVPVGEALCIVVSPSLISYIIVEETNPLFSLIFMITISD